MTSFTEKQTRGLPRLVNVLVLTLMLVALAFLSLPGHAAASARVAPDPTTADLEQYAFDLINQSRAAAGLPAYVWNDTLADGARAHSALNLAAGGGGCADVHQCPGEPDICTRITNEGVAYTQCAENTGYWEAFPTLDAKQGLLNVHQFFMSEGPGGGHYENIMSNTLQQVGIGVVVDNNRVWVTTDFIQP